jgi:hypothetical protein
MGSAALADRHWARLGSAKLVQRDQVGSCLGSVRFFQLGPSTVVLPLLFCEMLSYGGLVADNDHLISHQ